MLKIAVLILRMKFAEETSVKIELKDEEMVDSKMVDEVEGKLRVLVVN